MLQTLEDFRFFGGDGDGDGDVCGEDGGD